jgi:hypothetical protein
MANATTMYHTERKPLKRVDRTSERVPITKGLKARRLHKAFLRYHDPDNWPLLREALQRMGRADLIGNGKHQLIPRAQPMRNQDSRTGSERKGRPFATQHNGLPKTPELPSRRNKPGNGKPTPGKNTPSRRKP